MLEWNARLLTVLVIFAAFADRLAVIGNWNW